LSVLCKKTTFRIYMWAKTYINHNDEHLKYLTDNQDMGQDSAIYTQTWSTWQSSDNLLTLTSSHKTIHWRSL